MSITAAEIKSVVLGDNDFGHEMRVGNVLKEENIRYAPHNIQYSRFESSHGGTYDDPVTGKARQYDYRCQISKDSENKIKILLPVECKNLNPELPLVICGKPRAMSESYHVYIEAHGSLTKLYKVSGFYSIYKPTHFVGKKLLRLKIRDRNLCADGDSEIYDRWAQALASSHDPALEAITEPSESLAFVLPVVVVPDNSLWAIKYNDNGELEGNPEKLETCAYYVNKRVNIGYPLVITHIHFATITGLSHILSLYANADSTHWGDIFNANANEFMG